MTKLGSIWADLCASLLFCKFCVIKKIKRCLVLAQKVIVFPVILRFTFIMPSEMLPQVVFGSLLWVLSEMLLHFVFKKGGVRLLKAIWPWCCLFMLGRSWQFRAFTVSKVYCPLGGYCSSSNPLCFRPGVYQQLCRESSDCVCVCVWKVQ